MIPSETVKRSIPKWIRSTLNLPPEISEPHFLYLERLKQFGEMLILEALSATKCSESYRPFAVGCAVVGIGTHTLSAPRVFRGHNMKVHKTARVTCSEVIAIGAARQAGCSYIPLIAVVGNRQEDHGSGLIHPTLHPCHRCRDEFSSLDCVTDETIIITCTIEAAETLKDEAVQVYGKVEKKHDEKTGFFYYNPLTLKDDQEPKIWIDTMVQENTTEVMSLQQLLSKHNHVCT